MNLAGGGKGLLSVASFLCEGNFLCGLKMWRSFVISLDILWSDSQLVDEPDFFRAMSLLSAAPRVTGSEDPPNAVVAICSGSRIS